MTMLRQFIVKTLQATRLNKLAHRIYYSRIHGFDTASPSLLSGIQRALEHVQQTGVAAAGDYYEFGVFKGYAFWHAQKQAQRLGLTSMRFYGFDSFAGLPDVDGLDSTSHNEFYKGQFACSREQVAANLDANGIDWDRTFLIEGYYEDSLTGDLYEQYRMRPIAVALIDCDLYASTCEVLRFIEPLIQDGSLLMFDDWSSFDSDNTRGQQRALREFLEAHPEFETEELFTYGKGGQEAQVFTVRRAAPEAAG